MEGEVCVSCLNMLKSPSGMLINPTSTPPGLLCLHTIGSLRLVKFKNVS